MRHSIQGYEVFKAIGTSTSICDSGVEYFRTNWLRLPKGRHGSMRSSSRTFYRTDVCSRKDRCVRMHWGTLWTPDPVNFPGTFAPVYSGQAGANCTGQALRSRSNGRAIRPRTVIRLSRGRSA